MLDWGWIGCESFELGAPRPLRSMRMFCIRVTGWGSALLRQRLEACETGGW